MKKILIMLFAFVVFFQSCYAQNICASKLYEQRVNSVFFVETQSVTGSGIILSEDGTFATCFHIIGDANYIKVKDKKGDTYKVTGYKFLDPVNDIAILTIKSTKKFIPFSAIDSNKLNIGENIYTISNPIDLQFVFSSGIINRLDKQNIQFSAPSSPGSSGGALIDSSGNLVGMITSQYNPSKAQNINFAVHNKFFITHLGDKTKINTKGLPWSEFVASKLSQKDLKIFINYAYENDNFTMLYKYLPYFYPDEDVSSDDYAFRGLYALRVFIDEMDNLKILDDASKWFSLAILSNQNVEESAFGLFVASLFNRDSSGIVVSYEILKKYPKSFQKLTEILNRLYALKKEKISKKEYNKAYLKICIDSYQYCIKLANIRKEDK